MTLGLKRGVPSRVGPGAVVPLATLKRRPCLWIIYWHRCLYEQPTKYKLWMCNRRGTLLYGFLMAIYRVSQEERTKLWEGVPYVKLYRYNPKHLCPNLNGYGDNGKRRLKLWQLLHTYWLPNTYWNWQEYVVYVMLISVHNIKVTCEWH